MKNWKEKLRTLVVAMLLILLGIEFYMEVRYPCDEIALKSEDTAAILRRSPETEITEKDKEFMDEISQCPSMRDLLDGGEDGYVSAVEDPDMGAVAVSYLGEEKAESLMVNVMFQENGDITEWSNWGESGKDIFVLQRRRSGEGMEYFKIFSHGGFPGRRTTYENWDNERVRESVVRRRWFAWLRDCMWEDEI